jgi:hypothetical protein
MRAWRTPGLRQAGGEASSRRAWRFTSAGAKNASTAYMLGTDERKYAELRQVGSRPRSTRPVPPRSPSGCGGLAVGARRRTSGVSLTPAPPRHSKGTWAEGPLPTTFRIFVRSFRSPSIPSARTRLQMVSGNDRSPPTLGSGSSWLGEEACNSKDIR